MGNKYIAREYVVFCEVGEGAALLDTEKNIYFSLNATGSLIWNQLSDEVTVSELSQCVAETYEIDADICHADVEGLLDKLQKASLVDVIEYDEAETYSNGS